MKHSQHDDYLDHSDDLVARVRAAKEAAQRKMEEFGDPSEYDITIIHGQGPEEPEGTTKEVTPSPVENQRVERQTTVELIESDLQPRDQEE